MDIKFRAMTDNDYMSLGGCVRTAAKRNAYTSLTECLDSQTLFGENPKHGSVYKSLARANKRAFIKLEAPVFNYVLSRSHASLLANILGMNRSDFDNIINCTLIWDTLENGLVPAEDAVIGRSYLYGAQIAAKFIDDLDIEKAIKENFLNIVAGEFKTKVKKVDYNVKNHIIILKPSEEGNKGSKTLVRLPAGYRVDMIDNSPVEAFKNNHSLDTLERLAAKGIFSTSDSTLSYLLNLSGKEPLYGMLNYYIAVVPSEMRPETMGRQHPLTGRYAAVISANQDLGVILTENAHPKDVAARFYALDQAVSRLQYKCRELGLKSIKEDDMSIIERMKGKAGQIRLHSLGKRQDYSGRSVVIVNPYLPLDVIRVPRKMLPSLLEFHVLPYLANNIEVHNKEAAMELEHSKVVYNKLKLTNLSDQDSQDEVLRIIEVERLLEKIPMFLGRQPTLHKLGMQGFHVEPTDALGIEVNPLVCPAFNMDFDGDTGHIEVPLSPQSIKEVNDLLLTTQNLYLPKTGECTIMPRQDMLYGLYVLTRSDYTVGAPIKNYSSLEEVRNAVMLHQVKAWDTVTAESYTSLAGELAFISCFPSNMIVPRNYTADSGQLQVKEITNKTIASYINKLLETDDAGNMKLSLGTRYASTETFTGTINHIVELSFRVARIYTPSMSLLSDDVQDITKRGPELETFHSSMKDIDFYYSYGLETSANYKLAFDKHLEIMQRDIEKSIYGKLAPNNGYGLLAKSGARGSRSNLVQIFSFKGRVKKNSNESFDALVENSYASQLAPIESFIAAYGGRQGQIDKSLNTGKTGYASRQMWHASAGISINCADCGTSDGLKISKEFLTIFSAEEDSAGKHRDMQEYFAHAITGRFEAGTNKFISKSRAEKLAEDESISSIVIRSPIKCVKQCCAKCYGINWGSHRLVHVGYPADIIAAQSIGEPGTQLTMKEFQKGGVATKGTLTSAFSKVVNYLTVTDMSKKPGYDPVAWKDGNVVTYSTSDTGIKELDISSNEETETMVEQEQIKDDCPHKKIKVPVSLRVKSKVEKGEGFSYVHGDYCIHELLDYMGIDYAQLYLMFKLFSLYRSECKIAMVHFEVLVASMTQHMIMETDRTDLRVGQYSTTKELYSGSLGHTRYVSRILSIRSLPTLSSEALDSINMENHVKGLSRACLLKLTDSMTKPLNRVMMGKSIVNGSNVPGFIANGKERI